MARKISLACPPAPPEADPQGPGMLRKTYAIKLVTPLFGGGVETSENDPITLIRPPSIRGHLRFWWRATRGAACESVHALRQREAEIWGSTDNPSPLKIETTCKNPPPAKPCAEYLREDRNGREVYKLAWKPPFANTSLPYALFPFQSDNKARQPGKFIEAMAFQLDIWLPEPSQMAKRREVYNRQRKALSLPELSPGQDDIENELEAAIWGWVNFGGIGARTRRGCGALYCKPYAPPSLGQIPAWLRQADADYGPFNRAQTRPWPLMRAETLVHSRLQRPVDAWAESVKLMRDFRQGGTGRNAGPGRSFWPEADSLRALTGRGDARHRRSSTLTHPISPGNVAFPRAALGLPIVFHFKDGADSANDCELYPQGATRMASPLILRPLAVNDGTQAVAMVLRLNTPGPESLALKHLDALHDLPPLEKNHIARLELADYAHSPMGHPPGRGPKRSAQGSALEAFIAFALEKGFEVAS